jgi:hypothetical protein
VPTGAKGSGNVDREFSVKLNIYEFPKGANRAEK